MRLRWFEVQGYKNIEGRVRLDEIGRFNVLHGDNNVGKSNLLESIGLLFVALRALREEAGSGPGLVESITRPALPIDWKIAYRSGKYFAQRGFAVEDIFHVATQEPIEITAHVVFDPADRAPHEAVEIAVSIERREDDATISLRRLKLLSGDDLAIGESKDAAALVLERLSPRPSGKIAEPRFLLIRADRTVISEPPVDDTAPLGARESLPPPLALALHDAELSRGPSRERFDRFLAAIEHARDLVGEGRWQMRYYPAEERADLVLERPRPGGADMIPLRLMGSGVQQLAAIAGFRIFAWCERGAIPTSTKRRSSRRCCKTAPRSCSCRGPGGSARRSTSRCSVISWRSATRTSAPCSPGSPSRPRMSQSPMRGAIRSSS